MSESSDGLHWRRFHPITPVVKGWKWLLALLVIFGQRAAEDVRAAQEVTSSVGVIWILGVAVGVLALATGFAAVAWRMTRYAIGPDAVYLKSGVVFRKARTARLDRIQAIDVVQPLLARLIGLAELKIEVAGGAGSAVRLSFLKEQGAQDLRAELLARAAGLVVPTAAERAAGRAPVAGGVLAVGGAPAFGGVSAADGAPVAGGVTDPGVAGSSAGPGVPGPTGAPGYPAGTIPVAPEREVYAVTAPRLFGSLLRSVAMIACVLFLVLLVVMAVVTGEPGAAFGMFPAVFAVGGFIWQRFAGEFNFRAALSPDGIRLRHGLLEARAQTVPPGRVQAVSFSQGPLWRGKDWWRVQMNVAGYGTGQSQQTTETVLLPVGDRQEALLALWMVLPDLGAADAQTLLDAALTGSGEGAGFVTNPARARWLNPWTWRRNAVAFTDRAVFLRGGRFVRRLVVVPHERTQSLGLRQGPLQRGLHLASFALHSTPGPVAPVVPHLDEQVAGTLLREQAARARVARARSGPERWMAVPGDGA